jgi:hypothetical protein
MAQYVGMPISAKISAGGYPKSALIGKAIIDERGIHKR